jgi:nucleoside-diphosphate-sugar epimerase
VRTDEPLARDLDEIVERSAGDLSMLRGARIFITGGTGFVGSWLLESLTFANRRLALGARAVVLTRDTRAFATAAPHLANDPAITLLPGDVRKASATIGTFDAVVHAATPASAKINEEQPRLMIDTVIEGTKSVLQLAHRSGRIPVLFTSSGAVYGRQPADLALIPETYAGAPDPLDAKNAYHESKRLAELLFAIAHADYGVRPKIARLFAFVGPYLPIDRHFAIGNFIRDALAGKAIEISGDGTPVRTYLYAADMVTWLWRILVRGEDSRAYNVGSEVAVSIAEAATQVARCASSTIDVVVRQAAIDGQFPHRYACSTERARTELNLSQWTPFEEAIGRTLTWHRIRERGARAKF